MTTCGTCGRGAAAGMRFCTGCGGALPSLHQAPTSWGPVATPFPPAPQHPAPQHPAPSWSDPVRHSAGPGVGPGVGPIPPMVAPAARSGSSRGLVVALAVLLVVAVALGIALVTGVGRSTDTTAAPVVPAAATPLTEGATVAPSSPSPTTDPAQALADRRTTDATVAESTVGMWVPQLSAKNEGLVADGRTYDAAAIWTDHESLRAAHPGSFLVWSGDYTSFRNPDFWVTLVARPFATSDEANAWCTTQGFAPTQCLAKRLSHTGGPQGNTAQRPGS